MGDSASYYKSFKLAFLKDIDNKTIIVKREALKKSVELDFQRNPNPYKIGMSSFDSSVKIRIMTYVNKGYKAVFECDGKRVLIMYNK